MPDLENPHLVGSILAPEIGELLDQRQSFEVRSLLLELMDPEIADVLMDLTPAQRAMAFSPAAQGPRGGGVHLPAARGAGTVDERAEYRAAREPVQRHGAGRPARCCSKKCPGRSPRGC